MAGLTFSPSTLETALAVPQDPDSITQAAGLAGVGPSSADIVKARDQGFADLQTTAQAVAGMRRPPAAAAGAAPAGANPQSIIAFSPSANKFYAGGLTFSPDDVPSALRASQQLTQPTPPAPGNIAGDWQFVSPQDFGQYVQGLGVRRGAGANFMLGLRGGVESAVGGVGRLAELAGATEAGPAIAGFAEKTFGQTPSEQARSALIQKSNSLWSNILDATYQGAGSLLPTIAGAITGAAIGGPVGAAVGAASTAARGTGATLGAAASIFPMEYKSFYDAAQKNGYDVTDSRTQVEMLAAAAGTTLLQSLAPAMVIKGFSQFFKEAAETAGQQVARGALRNAATGAAKTSLTEGFAEALTSLAQQAVFDPEFRRKLNTNDKQALAPFIIEKYGEEALISFGAGALLGGAFGGAANFRATKPVNLTEVAGEQAGKVYGPPERIGPPAPPSTEQFGPAAPSYVYQQMELPLSSAYNPDLGLPLFSAAATPYQPAPATPQAPVPAAPNVAGLPLFDAAAAQPLQVAPGTQFNLFPNLPTQVAPAPAPGPGVQLGLPLEGQQLALNLQQSQLAPAPLPAELPTIPAATPAQRAAAFEATRPTEGALAPGLRRLLARREAAAAEAQRARQEQEAVAARTAAAEPEMRAQAALEERTILDTEGASTTDKVKNAGRRKTIAGFNNLTAEQQNRVLAEFDNDTQQFFNYIKATTAAVARKNLARIAGVEPEAFNVETPAPAEPQPAAQPAPLRRGEPSATETRQQPKGGQRERKDAGKGRAASEAGRGDSLKQGGQKQAAEAAPEVTPAPKVPPVKVSAKQAKAEWDNFFDDGGAGYTALPDDGKKEWKSLVARGDITQTEADAVQAKYAPKSPAPKEAAAQRPPEGEAAPSPKPAPKARKVSEAAADLEEVNTLIEALPKENNPRAVGDIMSSLEEWARDRSSPRAAARAKEFLSQQPKTGRFSLKGYNTVTGAIDLNGKTIERPIAEGRARIAVRNILAALTVKPDVRIFRDQADLKSRAPALYKQAVAAREQGDFDKAPAAGYSFGNNQVILFTDRIANEQHLRFVLAHETLGHIGLRALMPANKFDPFMESLYDTNPRIRGAVDAAMTNRKLGKAEAVEEYLSDYAGLLETSMVRRVWDAIKGGLNRLGIKFGDEAARYWLDQARRYVRTGQANMFDAVAIAERLQAVETGGLIPGRFSVAGIRSDQERIIDAVFRRVPYPKDLAEGLADVRRMGAGVNDWWDKFKGKYLSLSYYRARGSGGRTLFEQIQSDMTGYSKEIIRRFDERLTPVLDSKTAERASNTAYNMRVFADAKVANEPAPNATSLFTIDSNGEPQVKQADVDALFNKHLPTLQQLRSDITLTYKDRVGDREVTREVTIPGDASLTKEVYDEAVLLRRLMADVEVEVLRERVKSRLEANEIAYKAASRIMKAKDFTADERRFVVDTAKKAKAYINDDATGTPQSEAFLAAVNEAIIAKGFDDKKTDPLRKSFFDSVEAADAYIDRLKNFRKNVSVNDANKFVLQNKVREIIAADAAFARHTRQTKQSILSGYVPVIRTGDKQVRVYALVDNKPVTLAPEVQDSLALAHFESEQDAQTAREALNSSFKGKTVEALVLDVEATTDSAAVYKPMQVSLVAKIDDVLEVPAADPRTNLDDFLAIVRRLDINLTPSEMEKVITTLTATTDAARRRLQFSNTPGYDRASAPSAVAKHIQSRSSTIAKLYAIPKMDQLLDRDGDMFRYWTGNRDGVIALKEQLDAAKSEPERTRLKRALDFALYQYKETNLGTSDWDGSRETAPPEDQITRSRINRAYNESVRTLASIVSAKSLTDSEFESKRGVSELRAGASIMYLGLSVSNGLLNLASVQTNWLPYIATYNEKNGFGGGFGFGRAQAELLRAMKQVGSIGAGQIRFSAAEYFDKVASTPALLKKHGLTKVEAEFIAEQTRRGVMIPAESNALLSTALGRANRPYMRKFVDTVMYPFNVTEQIARRAAGLAAFRMEYDRQIAAGVSSKDAAAAASDFAAQSLKLTVGGYDVLDRPPAWRQGLPGLLYTFKTYPTTVIQLMRSLSPKGQIAMLSMLWMMSGVAGFPLAEDAEDIVDTIAQILGLKWAGARVELTKILEDTLPGISPLVLKGAVSTYMGLSIDLGAKFSMGDVLPGTGILLAGAKPEQELLSIAGPVASAGLGVLGTARDLIAAPFSSTKTLEDAARSSPMTFLRTIGDASAYLSTGAIVDRRGYVVSPDLTAGAIIGRLMGFYPKAAADQYDVIKYANRMVNYQKEATTGFRQAWIKAKLRGDDESAAAIEESVRDWNAATRGTGLEIRNFVAGSSKALREARRPAGERALRAAPTAARQDVTGIMDAFLN